MLIFERGEILEATAPQPANSQITVGRTYEVLRLAPMGDYVWVTADDGIERHYPSYRFISTGTFATAGGPKAPLPAPRLIAFSGPKGSGKDTAASVFTARGYTHVKMAGALKEMLRTLLAYRGAPADLIERMIEGDLKEEPTDYLSGRSPRYAMQTLGTEWGRELMAESFWLDAAEDRIKASDKAVVSDARFQNEAEMIRRLGGAIYRIERPGVETGDAHASETELREMEVDGVLFNTQDTIDAFRDRVIRPLAA